MQSLLGQFYTRIKGSQEDIASESLTYILQHSKSARLAINKIIMSDFGLELEDLNYITQNAGDKLERPDISGFDAEGHEVLILEAKFWASLTENQPLSYLRRLKQNSALIFICPTLRVRSLFNELIKRIKEAQVNFTTNQENNSFRFDNNKHLKIKTWNEILGMVKLHLVQDNEQALISDIDQIIGFCDTIDSNTFMPIQGDDLSPKYAKRFSSYYDLIDKVADEIRKRGIADTIGLKATPQRCGYTRYMKTQKFGISLNLKFNYWAEFADTPFWLNIQQIDNKKWKMSHEINKECKKIATQLGYTIYDSRYEGIFFALFPILDKTEDIVIKDFTEKITIIKNSIEIIMETESVNKL